MISTATFTPVAEAYSGGDIVESAKEFAGFGPQLAADVMVTSVSLLVSHTAVISGETSYRLHLYNVTPPSALANNAAWDIPSGDRDSYMGYLDLGTPADIGSSLYVQVDGVNRMFRSPAGGSVYGYLVTNGGFTATAAARKVVISTVDLS